MNNGWIRLYRNIRDNPMWKKKPFSKGQAWVDLLLRANYKEGKVMVGNKIITVLAGQVFTSQVKLADNWGWSRCKVQQFLDLLFDSDQVVCENQALKKARLYSLLTITNYRLYQSTDNEIGSQIGSEKAVRRQCVGTYNNDKNNKNDKKRTNNTNSTLQPPANLQQEVNQLVTAYEKKFPQQRKLWGVSGIIKIRDRIEGAILDKISVEAIKQRIDNSDDGSPFALIGYKWMQAEKQKVKDIKSKARYQALLKELKNKPRRVKK